MQTERGVPGRGLSSLQPLNFLHVVQSRGYEPSDGNALFLISEPFLGLLDPRPLFVFEVDFILDHFRSDPPMLSE